MEFIQLEELLFSGNGACMSESEIVCRKKLKEASEWLKKVDAKVFTMKDYLRFVNIFIRFSMCSLSAFHEIGEYGVVMAQLYQLAIDSPFYEETDV